MCACTSDLLWRQNTPRATLCRPGFVIKCQAISGFGDMHIKSTSSYKGMNSNVILADWKCHLCDSDVQLQVILSRPYAHLYSRKRDSLIKLYQHGCLAVNGAYLHDCKFFMCMYRFWLIVLILKLNVGTFPIQVQEKTSLVASSSV